MSGRTTVIRRLLIRTQQRVYRAAVWCCVLIPMGFCSCTSVRPVVDADPFQSPSKISHPHPMHQSKQRSSFASDPYEDNKSQPAPIIQQAAYRESSDGIVRITSSGDGQIAAVDLTDRSNQTAVRSADFTPAEPRLLVQPASGLVMNGDGAFVATTSSPDEFPDEYLFDGGDRGLPIHYDPYNRLGVETEDTIAEFVDGFGDHHVKSSNRVAIYSPRFGAVRTVSAPHAGTSINKLASNYELTHGVGVGSRVAPIHHAKNDRVGGMRVRSRASGIESETIRHAVDQTVSVVENNKLLNLYEDFTFIRTGQFKQSDEARLAYGLEAAAFWTRNQNPVIATTTESVQEAYATFKPEEIVGLEDPKRSKGRLRIVKLADKKVAALGDIITFTIRYDNLGEGELKQIRIIDNLTPRLEYVEDSETSDRPGNLVLQDNNEGSLLLQFELDDPLPGKTGGVVTFQARVR